MILSGCIAMGSVPVRAERKSAVYKCGEEIRFKVAPEFIGEKYSVNDGVKNTAFKPVTGDIIVKAERPGFILVKVTSKKPIGKDKFALAGAAVEPEKIKPGQARPADFDSYWEGELKQMRTNKMEVISKTPVPADKLPANKFSSQVMVWDVHVRQGDVEVSGFLAVPKDSVNKKASCPGILSFLGASKVTAELPAAIRPAALYKTICFNVNFHGLENVLNRRNSKITANRAKVRHYQYLKADNRQEYAMRKIFLRTVLAADYIKTLPEYNGRLAVSGGSLGGCQSIVCAALVPEVQFCCATASAMSSHFGAKSGNLTGWPNLFNNKFTPKGADKVAPYFDVVNFASRIKCPVIMAVGFIDTTTPPASTYTAYNALTTKNRKMYHVVTGGHGPRLDSKETSVFSQGAKEFAEFMKNAR